MPRLHVLLCLGASACASATSDEIVVPDAAQTFVVVPSESKVTVHAALDHDGVTDEGVADLSLVDGALEVSFSDTLVVEDLTLAIDDVALPEAIYPGDIVLTDIVVTLPEPVRCADTCATSLLLSWNAVIAGELHPLAPQTLPGFALDVALDPESGAADLALTTDGEFWSYLGVVRLSDAGVWLRASAVPIIP